ncbi:hypothetical protein CU098_012757 [Rhizopus stolonifer]|uniref:Uncharacterized protein n=1 Tax=Rhizopus stolonifer TaxID=4846 RepID=A0A367KLA0_RHIST|nr:hypothetical protein CU098_012757 [Rhizopus stolonifer]
MFSDQQLQPQQEQPNEDDLIDMDEFLNAYGSDLPPQTSPELNSVTITDLPSSSSTRSPSPTIVTPGSVTFQK